MRAIVRIWRQWSDIHATTLYLGVYWWGDRPRVAVPHHSASERFLSEAIKTEVAKLNADWQKGIVR
jgi:hypothetical protein